MLIQPLVLCGGSGTRLWPLSREKYPKQLLQLTGEDSLFQSTIRRVKTVPEISVAAPMVVCNEEYRFVIAEQMRCIDQTGTLILEPTGKNTAPAITLGALEAMRDGRDPVLLIMPADHVISDTAAFQDAVRNGAVLADKGTVVTFGITPTGPETGFGYIQCSADLDSQTGRDIQSFVEKPNLALAQHYVDSGSYLWNSGIFMVRASVWLATLQLCKPKMLSCCRDSWNLGKTDGDFVRVEAAAFGECEADSIDYAVMEPITRQPRGHQFPTAMVIPISAGWSDVGSWDALWEVLPKDSDGNITQGDVLLHDSHNVLAFSQDRMVACVGVENLVVVETADAILVVDKNRTQGVKHIVERLRSSGRSQALNHRKVYRPWGWYDSVDSGPRFQVKRIVVKPGASLSLQMHHHRAEHWIVVSGTAKVTKDNETLLLSENQSTYIPLGTVHRLENPGRVQLEMIEVQSGSYLGEDDIVRFDDVYGRVSP
jgi:mannose-1-phosphate guanylyltransferase / mannose-6-phosphate isomerase